MEQSKMVKAALNLVIRRVRFELAGFQLPGHSINDTTKDTDAIREATKLYMSTWVEPILMAIRDGDTESLKIHAGNFMDARQRINPDTPEGREVTEENYRFTHRIPRSA